MLLAMTGTLETLEVGTEEQRQKSEGEKQMERLLRRCGFLYRYEHPLAVVERGKTRLWYPDFTLPEYGVIVEYAAYDGEQYEAALRYKEPVYEEFGVLAVFVYRDSLRGYWPARRDRGHREATGREACPNLGEVQEKVSPMTRGQDSSPPFRAGFALDLTRMC